MSTQYDNVLGRLQSVGLITEPQSVELAAALSGTDLPDEPDTIVTWLVEQQKLTLWQARELLEGRTSFLVGNYVLQELLGHGQVATVYKAVDRRNNRVAAVKVLAPELQQDTEIVARFDREMRLASKLEHPNIVTMYEGEIEGETFYMAMEFVGGQPLTWWQTRYWSLPVDWCCECSRQVATGLELAYEHGLVHRDIKPANLLVVGKDFTDPPLVKILDFGVARAFSETWVGRDLTKLGDLLGAPDYIAPEQAQDPRQADSRADIYSLGCTLFHLLTRGVPFTGEAPLEKLLARVRNDPPRLSDRMTEVDPQLDALVYKMMARDPLARHQTPAELIDELTPFCGNYAAKAAS